MVSVGIAERRMSATWTRHVDPVLVGTTFAISMLGALMIYSSSRTRAVEQGLSSTYYVTRQVVFLLLGTCAMFGAMIIDYRKLRDLPIVIYGAMCLVLFAVLIPGVGTKSKGTQGWFQLPGGFQIQPSEFAKIALILSLSSYLYLHKEELDEWRLAVTVGLVSAPIALVMLQPDFGTAMVLAVVAFALIAMAGASGKHLIVLVLLSATSILAVVQLGLLKEYQIARLTSFVNPSADVQGASFNTAQSKTAIGNGGITGQGLFDGSQTKLNFVPEQHTDFVFTAVGEELGFVGAATLLGLFGVLIWRLWRIATQSGEEYASLLMMGIIAMFVFQVFENIGMTMGIMPVTGIPLPFMSYGGSATISSFIAIGLAANVGSRNFV